MITSNGLQKLGFASLKDFVLEDVGSGIYIKEWKSAQPQPTESEIEAAHAEWQSEFDAQEYARNRQAEYPPIGDQLDALFHAGVFPADMAAQLQAVKDKYPKVQNMARTTIRTEDITASEVTTAKMAVDPTNATNLASGTVADARLGTIPADITANQTSIVANQDDIALLGFKVAANGSLARYNLVDQSIDDFQDASGVDASASTNEVRDSANYYSGVSSGGNYWGDESDGAVTISADTELTVPSKNGSYDGDMLVMNYSSLTIDAGYTLTTDQPGRGLLIYVSGDCTINGSLIMTGRGPAADASASGGSDSSAAPSGGLKLNFVKSGGTTLSGNSDFAGSGNPAVAAVANHAASGVTGVQYTWSRQGAAGASGGAWGTASVAGATGTAGTSTSYNLQSGGGAGGGRLGSGYTSDGSYGSCWGGGSGGATGHDSGASDGTEDGVAWGGAGGRDLCGLTSTTGTNKAAGNPTQAPKQGSDFTQNVGEDGFSGEGTGGFIALIVGGDLTIGGSGKIQANGVQGVTRASYLPSDTNFFGGSSGGGTVLVAYGGTPTNVTSSYVKADGGTIYTGSATGGVGGAGVVQLNSVTPDTYNDMTLISNPQTAESAPTTGDLVITYTNGAGTATVNTDIKAYISRDGSAYTSAVTLVDQGDTGGHTILTANGVDLSGITSGTSMRYKIETLNQSAAKQTRIQAVSLGWS